MAFADAFGVMPSVEEVADEWKAKYPDLAAFIDGADAQRRTCPRRRVRPTSSPR